jgi:hypothetical protein
MDSYVVKHGGVEGMDMNFVKNNPLSALSLLTPGGIMYKIGQMESGLSGVDDKPNRALQVVVGIVFFIIIFMTWFLIINGGISWYNGFAFFNTDTLDNWQGGPEKRLRYTVKHAVTAFLAADVIYKKSLAAKSSTLDIDRTLQQQTAGVVIALRNIAAAKGWKFKEITPVVVAQAMRGSREGLIGHGGAAGVGKNVHFSLNGTEVGSSEAFGGNRRDSPNFEDVPNYVLRQENREQDALNAYVMLKNNGGTSQSWPQFLSDYNNQKNFGYGSMSLFDDANTSISTKNIGTTKYAGSGWRTTSDRARLANDSSSSNFNRNRGNDGMSSGPYAANNSEGYKNIDITELY